MSTVEMDQEKLREPSKPELEHIRAIILQNIEENEKQFLIVNNELYYLALTKRIPDFENDNVQELNNQDYILVKENMKIFLKQLNDTIEEGKQQLKLVENKLRRLEKND